jgi:3-hydroxyacyl-[acyl-carrier-protein] dehydratase
MLTDNLYSVKYKDEKKAIVVLSDRFHPIFLAHFPTKPILPGFIHFEIVSELFDIEIVNIKKAKFNKRIEPNEILTYEKIENNFKVLQKNEVVASFRL